MRVFTATALKQGTAVLNWSLCSGKKGENLLRRAEETIGMQQIRFTGTYDEAKKWLISQGVSW